VEALSWEVRAAAPAVRPSVVERPVSDTSVREKGRRSVYFRGGWQQTPLYDRESLNAGARIVGPAIIEAPDTTVLVNPGQSTSMDRFGNLVMDVR
jgi:N-methylhydantoinase A/oxoprolinase/acetone carboxylase beta subunit